MGSWGYLFIQIPSKMQYKYGLTEKDKAIIEDTGDEIIIRVSKRNLGVREYGEKTYSTNEELTPIVEP